MFPMAVAKLLFVLLLMQATLASASVSTPKEVANAFYAWVIQYDHGGLPSESALKAGEDLLSTELTRLLRATKATEDRCVALTPADMKPPIFEGSLLVGNYESATKVISMRVRPSAGGVSVLSRLEYRYQKQDSTWDAVHWRDRLLLVRENGNWVVSDSQWQMKNRSLVVTLKDYIHANCRHADNS
jgi:hypothetical protein